MQYRQNWGYIVGENIITMYKLTMLRNTEKMKDDLFDVYKKRLVIKYGTIICLALLFVFRMSFMNLTNTHNPSLTLSLVDFGYEPEVSSISKCSYEHLYDKVVHSLTGADGMRLRIEVRSYSTNQAVSYAYEEEWRELKEFEQSLHSDKRCAECKIMRSSKDDVFEYIVDLNNEQWSSDLANAIYDYHEELPENGYFEHCVMLVRGIYLYRITFTESFDLTDENIAVIIDWYDEFESILNKMQK